MPQAVDGTLRKFALRVPEVIYQCSGIMIFGKRIKSLVFSTDLSIIKNVNAGRHHRGLPVHAAADHHAGAAARGRYPGVCRRRWRPHAGPARGQPRHVRRDAGCDRASCSTRRRPAPSSRTWPRRSTSPSCSRSRARTPTLTSASAPARTSSTFPPQRRRLPSCAASASSTPTCPSLRPAARRMRASSRPSKRRQRYHVDAAVQRRDLPRHHGRLPRE